MSARGSAFRLNLACSSYYGEQPLCFYPLSDLEQFSLGVGDVVLWSPHFGVSLFWIVFEDGLHELLVYARERSLLSPV